MRDRRKSRFLYGCRLGLSAWALGQFSAAPVFPAESAEPHAKTPIKHVIVIIGENRSFDHVFATYVPRSGQTIRNLLSQGIVTLDPHKTAIPGPNFQLANQSAATDTGSTDAFLL